MMGKFNFEDYRQPWETGPHWELKKEFIEKYEDVFEEDRLLCLAQAYANVILMSCSYPDPVMRQISELAKPLQLRKKFQGISSNTEATSKNEQSRVSEKRKSILEKTGKSFKQVKFCASSEEQFKSTLSPSFTNLHQPPSEQSKNSNPLCVPDQQKTQSLSQTCIIPSINTTKELKTVSQKEDNLLEEKKYERIKSVLGLPLVQNLAAIVETVKIEPENEIQSVMYINHKLGIKDSSCFKFDVDPDSPEHARLHISKFYIKDCEISSKTGFKKKEAKMLCAKAALSTLINLGMSHKHSSGVKAKVISTSQLSSSVPKNVDCMELLELFNKKIVDKNRFQNVPAVSILKSIASSLDMEDYVTFDTVSYKISPTEIEYCCKFFLKGILISTAKDSMGDNAKNTAAELGFQKLSNLSKFEIQNGQLELKHTNNIDQTFDSKTSSSNPQTYPVQKPRFILNRAMYNFSLRDGFVVVEREKYKSDIQQYSKTILSESVSFNHKTYDCQFEDVSEGTFQSKKAILLIDGKVVSFGIGFGKDEAKAAACTQALNNLKKKYYTLRIKDEYIEGFIVTRNQVFDGESFASNVISESNIGCKMLKSMGWTGGGLGDKGIAEPIQATAKLSLGTGLGFEASKEPKNSQLFRKRLDALLREFCRTENYSDLVFSKDFTKEERKIIHLLANRMHLHTQSRGVGNERFLTVRQKYETLKLLKFLVNNGGSNSKFELIDDSRNLLQV